MFMLALALLDLNGRCCTLTAMLQAAEQYQQVLLLPSMVSKQLCLHIAPTQLRPC